MMQKNTEAALILVIHNVRSAHNVGSMFRAADGAGVQKIILTGYTPVPPKRNALCLTDAQKAFKKTALGAEQFVSWKKYASIGSALMALHAEGYEIVALEQSVESIDYQAYVPYKKTALVVGNEVRGLEKRTLKHCAAILEIPMLGSKNSLNVAVATGVALYQIRATMKMQQKQGAHLSPRFKKHRGKKS